MATVDTVVPNSLNYTDIKPQSIENEIKLVRFQPTSTVTGAKGGDMIKFMLSGNGFLDPYSTFLQFTVKPEHQGGETERKFVDRSAHSFIQRIIIRSQGVELERIENYDIIAAMVNDMIYSPEQAGLHYWEGFPTHSYQNGMNASSPTQITNSYQFGQLKPPGHEASHGSRHRALYNMVCSQGASPVEIPNVGEVCFQQQYDIQHQIYDNAGNTVVVNALLTDTTGFVDNRLQATRQAKGLAVSTAPNATYEGGTGVFTHLDFLGHQNGFRVPPTLTLGGGVVRQIPIKEYTFHIPIYSGILGLLMPEKKLLPLNLLPLDIEIVMNPHALYSSSEAGSRNYTVTKFNMYGHMIFFDQEIHRTLEASVADHGLFIYCNSFHSAPQQLISTPALPSVAYISMNLKSINSVHVVFMYNVFETSPVARKLHFVSHNLTSLQLLNGTQLIPQYAIEGNSGSSLNGQHLPFILELYKAWNKLHDPKTDGAIRAYNFCSDSFDKQFDELPQDLTTELLAYRSFHYLLNKQAFVGRCQYAISLEGEELGTERTMITGRKSQYPFLLQIGSHGKSVDQTSYMFTFLKADFIVYIRPDLQIVTLGK